MKARSVAAAGLVLAAAFVSQALAGPQGKWTPVTSGGEQSTISNVGVARTADGTLHVVWQRKNGSTDDLLQSSISPSGSVSAPVPIVTGWNAVDDADLVVGPNGELMAFWAGTRTVVTGEPLFGLNLATSTDGGTSWALTAASIYTKFYAYGRTPSVAVLDGIPIQTWYYIGEPVVHVGLDPGPDLPLYAPPGLNENIAAGSGAVVIAWCNVVDVPPGVWVAPVNPSSGAPAGDAHRLPGSATVFDGKETTSCPAASRTALTARVGGGFFAAALGGYPSQKKVLVWQVGSPKSTVVAQTSESFSIAAVALAAAPDGRLWIGWSAPTSGGPTVYFRRSNRSATAWGEAVAVKAPSDFFMNLDLDAQPDRLDVLGRFQSSNNAVNLFHTQVSPGLTLIAKGGNVTTFRVLDAGDPVAGAAVKVGGKTLKTNAKGIASIDLPAGKYKATASKGGYVSASRSVRAS